MPNKSLERTVANCGCTVRAVALCARAGLKMAAVPGRSTESLALMRAIALFAVVGMSTAADVLAACPISPTIFATVTIQSCETITLRAFPAEVTLGESTYQLHPPGAEYQATLLAVRVNSSGLWWHIPPPHPVEPSDVAWPSGSFRNLVMDGDVAANCGNVLPKNIEVATSPICCDTVPSSGGKCLVPRELAIVRLAPSKDKWYQQGK
jgi:hypothetical protein